MLSSASPTQACLYSCYTLLVYLFNRARTLLLELTSLIWRFLELHLHKIIVIVLFATSISQISILYWLLLVFVICMVPLSLMNTLTYPLVTLYLGVVTIMKTIYQFPVILESYFEFPASNSPLSNCSSMKASLLMCIWSCPLSLKYTCF